MNIKQAIRYLKNDPKAAIHWLQGEFWYYVYEEFGGKWVPERIRVQAEWRWFTKANKKCVGKGECIACGCRTPSLFFAEKGCSAEEWIDEPACYPPMITRKDWKELKQSKKDELFSMDKSKR